jgi:hypothetical protein
MDIDSVKKRIKEFAEENHLIQDTDIEKVENTNFNSRNYDGLHGKKFVSIDKYSYKNTYVIEFGKIVITVDKDDEGDEEYYGIDKDVIFSFEMISSTPPSFIQTTSPNACAAPLFLKNEDFLTEETMMEAIKTECKKYNFID